MKADRLFFCMEIHEESLNEVKLHENDNQITIITAAGVISNRDITISKSHSVVIPLLHVHSTIFNVICFIKRKKTKRLICKNVP